MNKHWHLCLLFLLYFYSTPISGQNPGFDTTIDRYKGVPDFSIFDQSKFSVTYHNWYKIITNNVLNQSYLVTYGGQPAPQNITGSTSTPIFVNVTSQSTIGVTGSSTAYAYLEILQLQVRVTYSDNAKLVTSPCYTNLSASNTPNIMISNTTTTTTGNTTVSGPTTIGFSPDETMTPLEQASWVMYLGYFFDLESNAFTIYEKNIQQQYTCHKDNVATSGAKTIAITHYDKNEWSLLQNNNSYYSTLISDAGMTAFNGTMANLHETDFVIDVSPSQSFTYGYSTWLKLVGTYDQNTQVFTSKKNVFRIDGLTLDGALDWTERSPARPDLAIQDVIHAIYPTYNTAYTSTWLRNFAKGDSPRSTQTAYPSCTDLQKMLPAGCFIVSFTPGDSSNNGSSGTNSGQLSTGAKIGTIVGVIMVVVGAGAIGFYFFYRKKKQQNPDHTFYKMNDV